MSVDSQEQKIEKELDLERVQQKLVELSELMIAFHEKHVGLDPNKVSEAQDFRKIQEDLEDIRETLM